jgi:hypothetical protein
MRARHGRRRSLDEPEVDLGEAAPESVQEMEALIRDMRRQGLVD